MSDTLKLALLRGYYIPDLEYWFYPPPVSSLLWTAKDWLEYIGDNWMVTDDY